ncbi:MAG: sterol desaturase family protein, partial [Bacteroidota bacterium]
MNSAAYFWILSNISSRYFMVAGSFFLVCYVLLYRKIAASKIQPSLPGRTDYLREIGFSLVTMVLFALIPLLIVRNPAIRPYTTLYPQIGDKGMLYYWCTFPIMLVMHDTYFYWIHRLMHHPKLYRIFHAVHHTSTNPSPWAAYAFHPLEAILEIGIFVIFLFTIPIHRSQVFIFFLFSIIYNAYGHLGWEIYSRKFRNGPIG